MVITKWDSCTRMPQSTVISQQEQQKGWENWILYAKEWNWALFIISKINSKTQNSENLYIKAQNQQEKATEWGKICKLCLRRINRTKTKTSNSKCTERTWKTFLQRIHKWSTSRRKHYINHEGNLKTKMKYNLKTHLDCLHQKRKQVLTGKLEPLCLGRVWNGLTAVEKVCVVP